MKIKKALSALLLPVVLATSIGTADAATKRRAVAPPPAPNYLVPITSKAPVSITNHDSKDARFTACYTQNSGLTGCDTETLQPENTFIYTPANDGMVAISSASPLEIRSTVDGTSVDKLIDNIGYIAAPNQGPLNLTVFTDATTTYEARLRDEFGNILADVTKTATPYTMTTQSLNDFFGTPFLRDIAQVEIIPQSGRVGAYITNANGASQAVRSQDLSNEVFLNAQAFVQTNPTGQSVVQSTYVYLPDQDNSNMTSHTDTLLTPHEARTFASSSALKSAMRLYATQNIMVPGMLTAADAALAKSGSFENQNESVNDVSVANVTGSTPITIWNISSNPNNVAPLTITGEVNVYSNGTQTNKTFTLRQYENHTYTLADFGVTSGNVRLHLNNDPNVGMNIQPRALLAIDGKKPYKVMPAMEKVTGENVAQAFFDPIVASGQTYYFNNEITRCMINGCNGVPSIKGQLAEIYTRGIGETWDKAAFENWLTTMADGVTNASNIELWSQAKPHGTGSTGTSYALTKSQSTFTNEPGGIRLTTSDVALVRNLERTVVVQYFTANPEKGCGTKETGPSLDPGCSAYTFGNQLNYP